MRIRIESDGTPLAGTKVFDDRGRPLDWVSDIQVSMPLDDVVRARLSVPLVGLAVMAEATVVGSCPHCGRQVAVAGSARDALLPVFESARADGVPPLARLRERLGGLET